MDGDALAMCTEYVEAFSLEAKAIETRRSEALRSILDAAREAGAKGGDGSPGALDALFEMLRTEIVASDPRARMFLGRGSRFRQRALSLSLSL